MSDFVLTCESAADRTREFFASRNIPVVCFHYEIDGVVHADDLYQSISPDEFFAQIAAGAMPKTSQVSVGEYEEFWEPFVAEGKDVLHLTLSSGISARMDRPASRRRCLRIAIPRAARCASSIRWRRLRALACCWNMPPTCAIAGFTRRDGCLDRGAQTQPAPLVLLDRSVELPTRRSHFGCERDHRHGA
ncbi:MAG: DegV family protein [Collinsella sp.]